MSVSIDNITYKEEKDFRRSIERMLKIAKLKPDSVISLTSHQISSYEWGITRERLEYVLKFAKALGLKFYTYKELTQ